MKRLQRNTSSPVAHKDLTLDNYCMVFMSIHVFVIHFKAIKILSLLKKILILFTDFKDSLSSVGLSCKIVF